MYENKSHKELIELINKRNEIIEILEKKLTESETNTLTKLVNDLKKQRTVQSELIHELRHVRTDLLRIIQEIEAKTICLERTIK